MNRLRISAAAAALGTLTASTANAAVSHPFPGVTQVTDPDRVLVIADLCAPGVSGRATKYAEREATPAQWAAKAGVNVDVAVNADFFDFPGWTYVVGRARGGGEDWPAGQQNRENRSYWQFGPEMAKLVEPAATAPSAGVTDIVGAHNVLVRGGASLAPNFDGDAVITTAHRRTAIGIDAERAHLYLFATNLNLTGSAVVTYVTQMAKEGGAPAVDFLTNEDGGGSSQMFVRGQGQVIDSGRQVNNHLGILAKGSGPAPMCPNRAPRGAFDAATCTSIDGWAQDPDVPTASIDVHVYFDGKPGAAGAASVTTTAANERPDLDKLLGSTKHGFALPTPYGIFDGKEHPVFPHAIDAKGSGNLLLGTKSVTCTATPPPSVRRHITSPAVLKDWGVVMFTDAMPLTDAAIDGLAPGVDVSAAPALIRADDRSPEVWLVDGTMRRHVVDGASAAAWHFDLSKVVTKPIAEVNALAKGPDVRARPLVARSSDGATYFLDDPASVPPGSVPGPGGGVIPPVGGANDAPGDDAGGCAVGGGSGGTWSVLGLAALGGVFAASRRRRRRLRKE
ncbi:MAG: putative exported peptidase [Labilithrix sp.]|nr:putative exported peptidase [Labilithrix sp.]